MKLAGVEVSMLEADAVDEHMNVAVAALAEHDDDLAAHVVDMVGGHNCDERIIRLGHLDAVADQALSDDVLEQARRSDNLNADGCCHAASVAQ